MIAFYFLLQFSNLSEIGDVCRTKNSYFEAAQLFYYFMQGYIFYKILWGGEEWLLGKKWKMKVWGEKNEKEGIEGEGKRRKTA